MYVAKKMTNKFKSKDHRLIGNGRMTVFGGLAEMHRQIKCVGCREKKSQRRGIVWTGGKED